MTGVQTCALPISTAPGSRGLRGCPPRGSPGHWALWPCGGPVAWEPQEGGGAGQQGGGGLTPRVGPVGAPAGSSFPWMDVWSGAGQEDTSPSLCPATPRAPAGGPLRCLGYPTPFGPDSGSLAAVWWDPQGGEQREAGRHPGSQCSRGLARRQICTPVGARAGCSRVLRRDRAAGTRPGPPPSAPVVASR